MFARTKAIVPLMLILILALALPAFACSQSTPTLPAEIKAVSLATMPAGTSTYTIGAALSTVWNKYNPFTVTQQPMQVTGPAFRLIKNGTLDLGITAVWAISGCYTGADPFWEMWEMKDFAPCPINQMVTGSALRYGLLTTNPNIKTLKDLEGKRMYITQPGSESDVQVKALFQAAGVDYNKVTDVKFSQIGEAQQGLKEGRAEAFYYTLAPWIEDVGRTKELYLVNIPPEVPKKMSEILPGWGFYSEPIKSGEFGLKQDSNGVAVPVGIYVREGLNADAVYLMTKTMYEHHDELVKIHEAYLSPWTKERAILVVGAPLHPGVIKYFKEAGLWTTQIEQRNTELLKMKRRTP